MSRQPALVMCNLEPALRNRLSPGAAIHITTSYSWCRQDGLWQGRGTLCRRSLRPGKLSCDLLQALHWIKSVRLFSKGAKLFSAGRRGDGRVHGGERRGAGPATDRSEPKAAFGGCRCWNDTRIERKHEAAKVSDHS